MRSCNVIRIAWALGLLATPLVQAAPVSVCTQQEIDGLNSYYLRAFQMALNAQALDVDTVIAFTAEGEDLTQRLSPDCRSGLQRVGNAVQERAQASGRPMRLVRLALRRRVGHVHCSELGQLRTERLHFPAVVRITGWP